MTLTENRKIYMKVYYQKRRSFLIEKLGGKCSYCGTTDNLQFDHIDHTKKEFSISELISKSLKRSLNELEKCQLLCKDCHDKKTKNDGSSFKNKAFGEKVKVSKLKEKDVIEIKKRLLNGERATHLGREFGVDEKAIRSIKTNQTWKHVQI
jgi:5-methylcytosine-specific restriction endonuclease McrA